MFRAKVASILMNTAAYRTWATFITSRCYGELPLPSSAYRRSP